MMPSATTATAVNSAIGPQLRSCWTLTGATRRAFVAPPAGREEEPLPDGREPADFRGEAFARGLAVEDAEEAAARARAGDVFRAGASSAEASEEEESEEDSGVVSRSGVVS